MKQIPTDNLIVKVASKDKSVMLLTGLNGLRKEAKKGSILDDLKGAASGAVDASKQWLSNPENQMGLATGLGTTGLLYGLTGLIPGRKKYRGTRLLLSMLGGAGAGMAARRYAIDNWPKKESPLSDNSWQNAIPRGVQWLADKIMGADTAEARAAENQKATKDFYEKSYKPFQENTAKAKAQAEEQEYWRQQSNTAAKTYAEAIAKDKAKQQRAADADALARSGQQAQRDTAVTAPAMLNYFNGLKAQKAGEERRNNMAAAAENRRMNAGYRNRKID